MDYDALRRRLQKEEEEAMERDEDEEEEEDAEDEVGGLVGLDLFSLGRVAALDSPADRDQFVAQLRRVWRRHRTRLAATKSANAGDGDGLESSDKDDGNTKEEAGEEGEGTQQQQTRKGTGLESRGERRQHAAFLRQLVGQNQQQPPPPHEFSLSSILSAIEEEGEDGVSGGANGSGGRQLRKRKVSGEAWSLPVQSLLGDASSSSSSASKKAKAAAASSSSSATSSPALGSSAPLPPGSPPTRSEKRLSRYRSAPSKALLERMEMAQELRMFLLFRSPLPRIPDAATAAFLPSAGGPGEGESADHVLTEYYVVGPTGTGHHCIHILFVLLKVLKVSSSDPILYQRALLTSELEGIYKSAPLAPAQAYARRKTSSSSSSSSSSAAAAPADQDLRSQCGICYEALAGKAEELVSCKDSCSYCFHAQCFHRYCSTHLSLNAHSTSPLARAAGSTVACPVCFTSWVVPPASGSPGAPPPVVTAVAAVAPVAAPRQPASPTAAAGATPGPTATTPGTDAAADVTNGKQQPPADADAALSGSVKQEPAEENPEVAQKEQQVEEKAEVEKGTQPEGEIAGEAQQ